MIVTVEFEQGCPCDVAEGSDRQASPISIQKLRRVMDVLCTDKTGTLTQQDKVIMKRHVEALSGKDNDTRFCSTRI